MPVHDLGYRAWTGNRSARTLRPLTIARNGISLIWRGKWLRLMLMLAWVPVTFFTVGIVLFEYSSTDPSLRQAGASFAMGPLARPDLAADMLADPASVRHEYWSVCIFYFFRYPQLFTMVILVGLIAPRLVSYDLRSKAYLQYFSRPLTPLEYILGKSAVIWFFLTMISTGPALILYVIGVMLSPGLTVVTDTWDIPLRIIAATMVLVIPTTAVAIFYSSMTSESRYATFGWFATWIMGGVAYTILTFSPATFPDNNPNQNRRVNDTVKARNPVTLVTYQAEIDGDINAGPRGESFGPQGEFSPQIEFGPDGEFGPRNGFQQRGGRQGQRGGRRGPQSRNRGPNWEAMGVDFDKWTLVSPYHTLGKVQSWAFGLEDEDSPVEMPIAVLVGVTLAATLITRHRLAKKLSI